MAYKSCNLDTDELRDVGFGAAMEFEYHFDDLRNVPGTVLLGLEAGVVNAQGLKSPEADRLFLGWVPAVPNWHGPSRATPFHNMR